MPLLEVAVDGVPFRKRRSRPWAVVRLSVLMSERGWGQCSMTSRRAWVLDCVSLVWILAGEDVGEITFELEGGDGGDGGGESGEGDERTGG